MWGMHGNVCVKTIVFISHIISAKRCALHAILICIVHLLSFQRSYHLQAKSKLHIYFNLFCFVVKIF